MRLHTPRRFLTKSEIVLVVMIVILTAIVTLLLNSSPRVPGLPTESSARSTTDDTVLDRMYTIAGRKQAADDSVWILVQRRASQRNPGPDMELWRMAPTTSEVQFIRSYPGEPCSSLDSWEIFPTYVQVQYVQSPCEALIVRMTDLFTLDGGELLRSVHNSSQSKFTFFRDGNGLPYTVSLEVDACPEHVREEDWGTTRFPSVLLHGIVMDDPIRPAIQRVPFAQAVRVPCQEFYGYSIIDPVMGPPAVEPGHIRAQLPSGHVATIAFTDSLGMSARPAPLSISISTEPELLPQ